MVRWVCAIKLHNRVPSKGLRERLALDGIVSVLQQNRLQWYGHVLRKEDNGWMKKCMEYEVYGARPRGRSEKTWREIVQKDCQARKLNRSTNGNPNMKYLVLAHLEQNPESCKTVVVVVVVVVVS